MAENTSNGRRRVNLTTDHQLESGITNVPSLTRSFVPQPATAWTPALVEERLRKAIAVRAALVDGHMSDDRAMGRSLENTGIIGGIGPTPKSQSGDRVIDRATEALSWLRWLEPDDAGIVSARFDGAQWKSICWRYGISRPTGDRRFRYVLALIAWRLNGNARTTSAPSLRSLLGMRRAA